MKNVIRWFWVLAGAALLVNAAVLSVIVNFNLGIIITAVFGLAFLGYGIWFEPINRLTGRGVLKWCKYACFLFVAFVVVACLFIGVYGQIDTVSYDEDAVVILGAGIRGEQVTLPLQHRLDAGIEYLENNPDALVIVSGGQGAQEDITEAEAMARYLLGKGVPKEQIIKEEQATSTYENFVFSKAILDSALPQGYKVAFVTNDFHIYRSGLLAKAAGLDAYSVHAKLEWYSVPLTYLREFAAVVKTWVMGK